MTMMTTDLGVHRQPSLTTETTVHLCSKFPLPNLFIRDWMKRPCARVVTSESTMPTSSPPNTSAFLCSSLPPPINLNPALSVISARCDPPRPTQFLFASPFVRWYTLSNKEERRAILFCQEDRAILCRECDIPIHKANEHTLKHNRFLLTGVKLSCPSSSSSSSSNGFDLPTHSHIKSSVISNQSSNPTSSIHDDKASLPSTNTTPCKANHDHDHHYHYVSQENSVSLSTSSISEYLMETLPGWRVDDFLDPSCFPHGFCKFSNHDLDKGWYPFPSEDLVICVPQAPIQSSHNTPLCPPQTGVINGVLKGSEEELDLMKFSRKWNEDGFTVPQISPPLKKSRQFW